MPESNTQAFAEGLQRLQQQPKTVAVKWKALEEAIMQAAKNARRTPAGAPIEITTDDDGVEVFRDRDATLRTFLAEFWADREVAETRKPKELPEQRAQRIQIEAEQKFKESYTDMRRSTHMGGLATAYECREGPPFKPIRLQLLIELAQFSWKNKKYKADITYALHAAIRSESAPIDSAAGEASSAADDPKHDREPQSEIQRMLHRHLHQEWADLAKSSLTPWLKKRALEAANPQSVFEYVVAERYPKILRSLHGFISDGSLQSNRALLQAVLLMTLVASENLVRERRARLGNDVANELLKSDDLRLVSLIAATELGFGLCLRSDAKDPKNLVDLRKVPVQEAGFEDAETPVLREMIQIANSEIHKRRRRDYVRDPARLTDEELLELLDSVAEPDYFGTKLVLAIHVDQAKSLGAPARVRLNKLGIKCFEWERCGPEHILERDLTEALVELVMPLLDLTDPEAAETDHDASSVNPQAAIDAALQAVRLHIERHPELTAKTGDRAEMLRQLDEICRSLADGVRDDHAGSRVKKSLDALKTAADAVENGSKIVETIGKLSATIMAALPALAAFLS